jgi:hypothetical protein
MTEKKHFGLIPEPETEAEEVKIIIAASTLEGLKKQFIKALEERRNNNTPSARLDADIDAIRELISEGDKVSELDELFSEIGELIDLPSDVDKPKGKMGFPLISTEQ